MRSRAIARNDALIGLPPGAVENARQRGGVLGARPADADGQFFHGDRTCRGLRCKTARMVGKRRCRSEICAKVTRWESASAVPVRTRLWSVVKRPQWRPGRPRCSRGASLLRARSPLIRPDRFRAQLRLSFKIDEECLTVSYQQAVNRAQTSPARESPSRSSRPAPNNSKNVERSVSPRLPGKPNSESAPVRKSERSGRDGAGFAPLSTATCGFARRRSRPEGCERPSWSRSSIKRATRFRRLAAPLGGKTGPARFSRPSPVTVSHGNREV